jgi:hypothetical protein
VQGPVIAKRVHELQHETFVAIRDVALDDEIVVNQPLIEEEVVAGL